MIVFVTTFNTKIYNCSAKHLLTSYIKHVNMSKDIEFHVYKEGNVNILQKRNDIKIFNIDDSTYLKEWISKNSDIIPKKYGGSCIKNQSYFNLRASLFFRKVVSLKESFDKAPDADMIIWFDSDITIHSNLDQNFFNDFKSPDIDTYYLMGDSRRKNRGCGIESCFLVFRNPHNILQEWIKYYEEEFRKESRWDDGYILLKVLEKTTYLAKDVGGSDDNPLKKSKYKHILKHNKGIHLQKRLHTM